MSVLGMLIWWHELSMLLIHHCISAFALADNLVSPSKLSLWYFKPVEFYFSKRLLCRGPQVTVGKLATIFPKILGNSLRDVLYLHKHSVSIVFILFFFSSVNDSVIFFDEIIMTRETIVWLGVNTDFSVWITKPSSLSNLMVSEILSRQAWYVSLGDMNHLHTRQSCDPGSSDVQMVL